MSSLSLLLADDDADDVELTREALLENGFADELRTVADGEELLADLRRDDTPRPDLVLLDLNMPRMDGRRALRELKADPALRSIPVVVLTTSAAMKDVVASYDLGASSYITKPSSFEQLVETMRVLVAYWRRVARPDR